MAAPLSSPHSVGGRYSISGGEEDEDGGDGSEVEWLLLESDTPLPLESEGSGL